MTKKPNYRLNAIVFLLFSAVFLIYAYTTFKGQQVDLEKCHKLKSTVTSVGTGTYYGNKGHVSKVFFVQLHNLETKLGIIRSSENYDDVLAAIAVGDIVKVYYKDSDDRKNDINIELVQLEKDGKIVINKSEYEQRGNILLYFCIAGGLICLSTSVRSYRRHIKTAGKA